MTCVADLDGTSGPDLELDNYHYLDAGDILIGDSHGNKFHVVVFANDGTLLGEFECPHVKVRLSWLFNLHLITIYSMRHSGK